ncbi:hypothetical protein [Mycobacterium sp. HM-7]
MWRQSLERQVDDVGDHDDDIAHRNIDGHSGSDVRCSDGGLVGTGHRIACTADACA